MSIKKPSKGMKCAGGLYTGGGPRYARPYTAREIREELKDLARTSKENKKHFQMDLADIARTRDGILKEFARDQSSVDRQLKVWQARLAKSLKRAALSIGQMDNSKTTTPKQWRELARFFRKSW